VHLPPFQTLIDEHGAGVHRLLVGLVGPTDADDCLQETLLAALRAYPSLQDAGNLRGWLFTIGRRKAIDAIRERRRAVPVADVDDVAAPDCSEALGVWGAVATLPPKQREAVALRFAASFAYAEIGGAMETTEEAARRNVHEGLKRLREVMPR